MRKSRIILTVSWSLLLCLTLLINMALHLSVLLIFTGLTVAGIHSVTTVSKVSVKAGGSISIPCLYDPKYTHHVKYLCKGSNVGSCSCKVKTDQPDSSGKFSISDDKQQRIFTVTINNLMMDDTDYWCIVEINDLNSDGKPFQLSVTRGWPQLFVDHQEITGFNGEDVTIHGSYSNTGEIEWCRLGGSCVNESSGSINGTRVTINANVPKVFTVTMSGLRTESSGWYFCTKGLLQMPVHVTVKERPSTTEPVNHTAVSAYGEPTTVQGGNHSVSIHLKSFIIRLSVLISIVMVASFIWFMFKRCKVIH
ncbi:polymeric immunoglobulin receptor-like [Dicentrarchus labrax]|uniref:polymeric immunoglobulin receptor-like n=1 Tax=Dicentrarchus labrax TaxID=13489 RepID=UPI0021F60444|nr:polymeric immunoglobulin receptor-like [Dicentrarchus labrax]